MVAPVALIWAVRPVARLTAPPVPVEPKTPLLKTVTAPWLFIVAAVTPSPIPFPPRSPDAALIWMVLVSLRLVSPTLSDLPNHEQKQTVQPKGRSTSKLEKYTC